MQKLLTALITVLMVFGVNAALVDITISDGLTGGATGPGYTGGEDQNLNYGSTWDQSWDLEAFFFDRETYELQMVSGFDAFSVHDLKIMLGDIFIKTSGSNEWNYAVQFNRNNTDGVFANNEYSIIDLTAGNYESIPLKGRFEERKAGAKPYAIADWDESMVVYSGSFNYGVYETTEFIGDEHFLLSGINLGALEEQFFLVHQTMSCGNDVVRGRVPEPAIFSFIGLGFIGIAIFRRKNKW